MLLATFPCSHLKKKNVDLSLSDRVRNEIIRERCGLKEDVVTTSGKEYA